VGYFDLKRLSDGSYTKPGMRGYPGLDPMQELLLEVVRDMDLEGVKTAVDLTARGGALALELQRRGIEVSAKDTSAAALNVLREAGLNVQRSQDTDLVCVILPADRGNALVRETVRETFEYTRTGGTCLIAGDKDRGFDRYFKEARALFGKGEILERTRGLRVARLEKTSAVAPPPAPEAAPFTIEARGRTLSCAAFPGTFSSGKLDPASKLLLEHLPSGQDRSVLDVGAGYGVLGGFLAGDGATVTLLEDDAFSVQSCRKTLELNDLQGRALHSDVDSALEPDAKFDLIVANPPFHVGSDLILDVALEFIRCAERRLTPGGEFWLVANHFLPYEAEMARIGVVHEVARERGFKVLMVKKPG
jgi:16S rRNA (guanine1207-N2)-methyltransferase